MVRGSRKRERMFDKNAKADLILIGSMALVVIVILFLAQFATPY